MDANQFDHLSRSLAAQSSRRKTLGWLGGGGLLAALTGRPLRAAAATRTCTLTVTGLLSAGTDANGTVDGTLAITVGDDGAIDTGSLTTTDGKSFDVVGQATGRSISLIIDLDNGTELALLGVGTTSIAECSGTLAGTIAGPQAGDLGSWTATASQSTSGSVLGTNSGSASGNSNGNGTTDGDCASGVICGDVCCEGAPSLTPDTITCNAGICECTYSCAAAGCDPNGTGTIVNTCGADPFPHCHSECNVPDDTGCGDLTCDENQMLDGNTCTCVDAGGGTCDGQLTNCGDEAFPICIDTTRDPNGCGGCGVTCASGSCIDSACTCLSDGEACSETGDCCSQICPPSGVCGCVPAGEACNNTGECCDITGIGGCVNGLCAVTFGIACTANAECISGKCVDGVCTQF